MEPVPNRKAGRQLRTSWPKSVHLRTGVLEGMCLQVCLIETGEETEKKVSTKRSTSHCESSPNCCVSCPVHLSPCDILGKRL